MDIIANEGCYAGVELPDTQAQRDQTGVAIEAAGVCGLRMPARITDIDGLQHATVARFDLGVRVPAGQRGTHMSRLVQVAQGWTQDLNLSDLGERMSEVLRRLDAPAGSVSIDFPWFLTRAAPKSGMLSSLDIDVSVRLNQPHRRAAPRQRVQVTVPVTTLCPCSKSISEYGAHNQRSYVRVDMEPSRPVAIAAIAEIVERNASCPVYAVLKREDEKHVTEQAYRNPKFAEDLVRDVLLDLLENVQPRSVRVMSENQESIHNHAAYAVVTWPEPDEYAEPA